MFNLDKNVSSQISLEIPQTDRNFRFVVDFLKYEVDMKIKSSFDETLAVLTCDIFSTHETI